MSKRTYEELRDMMRHELDVLTKKGEVTKESLDYFQKLTSTLCKIEELMKSEEGGMGNNSSQMGNSQTGGYSQRMYYPMPMSYEGQSMNQGGNPNNYTMNRGSYDGSYDGGANRGSYDGSYDGGSYGRQGRDGDSDGRYSEEGSFRRGRDYRGRYTGNEYSRHTAKERMIEKLETMADVAGTEKERKALMQCVEQLEGQ